MKWIMRQPSATCRRMSGWPAMDCASRWMPVNIAAWISALAVASSALAGDDLGRKVLVVYNESEPESKPLAEYYAQRRGVPTNQICAIHARNAEIITRREFNEQVHEPILKFMIDHGLLYQLPVTVNGVTQPQTFDNKILYLALIYGVPLRVDSDPSLVEKAIPADTPIPQRRNEASVDSELALLPVTGYPLASVVPNPFFNQNLS